MRDFDGNLIEMIDLRHMYYVLGWLGPLGGWLFRRGMYKQYYQKQRGTGTGAGSRESSAVCDRLTLNAGRRGLPRRALAERLMPDPEDVRTRHRSSHVRWRRAVSAYLRPLAFGALSLTATVLPAIVTVVLRADPVLAAAAP